MIFFNNTAADKIKALVKAFETEVAFYGYVQFHGAHLAITDIFVPTKQNVSAATAVITPEGDEEAMIWEEERQKLDKENPGRLLAHFHSHVNMGVTPSGTDLNLREEKKRDYPFYIVGIVNKKEEWNLVFYAHGYETKFEYSNIIPRTSDLHTEWVAELKSKIIKSVVQTSLSNYDNYDRHNYSNYRGINHGVALYDEKKKTTATKDFIMESKHFKKIAYMMIQ